MTRIFPLLVLLTGLLLPTFEDYSSLRKDNRNTLVDYNSSALQYDEEFNDFKVYCKNSDCSFDSNEHIYNFESTRTINNVYATGDASLISFSIIDCSISCTLGSFTLEEGQFTLYFEESSDTFETFTIYFCKGAGNEIFWSSLSIDVARRNANKELSYHFEENDVDESPLYSDMITTTSIGVTGSVSGYLKFNDNAFDHPLVGTKVKITISGSWWSSEGYTDENGYYSISYSDIWYMESGKPTIHIYASGENVSVKYSGIYATSHEFDGSSGDFIYNRTFSPSDDGDLGKAMNIFQAAQQHAAFAKTLPNSSAISHCDLYYPGDPSKGCAYNDSTKTIRITSKNRENTSVPESYCAWDVIGHEYGHHIQNCMGFSANVGGNHSSSTNDIDANVPKGETVTYEIKNKGLKLSWNESWPTYFSIVAQQSFCPNFKKTIFTVGDTYYTSYNGLNYDLDPLYRVDCALGDACERAIMRFLYKLSSPTTDSYDKFSVSFVTIWNIICASKATTLYDFVSALYDYGLNRHDLGRLLSVFNISVGNIEITNNYLDRCPTFTWSTYMGSKHLRYNEFDLVFVNARGQEILRKSNITSNSNNASYTLTRNEWSNIIAVYGRVYYVYVVARQTDFFTSGNYYSELFQFNEPDDFADKIQIKPSEWGFEPQYFFTTNKWKQTSTPILNHGLTITHDRLRCGYIENSYVVLSPRRENAGLAYLTMKFDQPVYSYMFGITLWSTSEGLNSYDSTAVVESMDEHGTWHEDMNLMTDLPNGFSIRTQQIDRYETAHTEGIYGLRFVLTSSAIGTRNKGRLCLDDLVLNTDPNDLWFISTFYE